jgi:hypothetical protein
MMLQPKKAENGRFPFDISHFPSRKSETVQLQRQDSLENHRNILVNEFVEALDLASKQLIPVSLFSIGSYSSSFKRCRNHLASSSTTSGCIWPMKESKKCTWTSQIITVVKMIRGLVVLIYC